MELITKVVVVVVMAASIKTQALLLGNEDIRFDRAFLIREVLRFLVSF